MARSFEIKLDFFLQEGVLKIISPIAAVKNLFLNYFSRCGWSSEMFRNGNVIIIVSEAILFNNLFV